MFRHEDFPCCGCGTDGCIDDTRTVTCADCGKRYHPDGNTEVYCYVCLAKPVYNAPKRESAKENVPCEECAHWAHKVNRPDTRGIVTRRTALGAFPQHVDIPNADTTIDGRDLCDGCADEYESECEQSHYEYIESGEYLDRYSDDY